MFETELNYFIDHQDELVAKHGGATLILKGAEVVGVYKTPLTAFLEARKRFDPGTFMLQPCEPGSDAYTVKLANF